MKKVMYSILTLLLAVVFVTVPMVPAKAATNTPEVNYVAFGDSVAAGVLYGDPTYPTEKSGKGYTNDLVDKLENAGFRVNFNDEFCEAGMTAKVLAQYTEVLNQHDTAQCKLVQNAQIVTLDVGANDLLQGFYASVANIKDIQNPTEEEAAAVMASVYKAENDLYFGSAGKEIQKNFERILQNILNANPKVKIYVMGYYNALPELSSYGMDLSMPVMCLNTYIYKAIYNIRAANKGAAISYVDTMAAMSNGVERGLLVPTDIHPTAAGYQVIANLFWTRMKADFLITSLIKSSVH